MITAQPRCHQHDRGRGARRVGGAGDREAAIGFLQRRRVVHAVAGHADDVAMLLQHVDDVEFVLRKHLGKTVGVLDRLGDRRVSSVLESPSVPPSRMLAPIPSVLAVSRAIARASPVTILIFTPISAAVATVALASSRGGSNSGNTPSKPPFPVAIRPSDAERAKAAGGEVVDGLVDGVLHRRGIGGQCQDHLRRALGHLEGLSVRGLHRRLGALVHRIERHEMRDLIRLQRLLVLQAAQHRQIDRVVILRLATPARRRG